MRFQTAIVGVVVAIGEHNVEGKKYPYFDVAGVSNGESCIFRVSGSGRKVGEKYEHLVMMEAITDRDGRIKCREHKTDKG